MSCDPNESAFGQPGWTDVRGEFTYPQSGLTKREYFAAIAMQGLLANGFVREVVTWKHERPQEQILLAEKAVIAADSLIAELNKERT